MQGRQWGYDCYPWTMSAQVVGISAYAFFNPDHPLFSKDTVNIVVGAFVLEIVIWIAKRLERTINTLKGK
jgi:hypothetical protein